MPRAAEQWGHNSAMLCVGVGKERSMSLFLCHRLRDAGLPSASLGSLYC